MTSLLRERGAKVLRVHDVAENADALRTTEALLAAAAMIHQFTQMFGSIAGGARSKSCS